MDLVQRAILLTLPSCCGLELTLKEQDQINPSLFVYDTKFLTSKLFKFIRIPSQACISEQLVGKVVTRGSAFTSWDVDFTGTYHQTTTFVSSLRTGISQS